MTIGANSRRLIELGPLVTVDVRHHPLSFAELKDDLATMWGEPPKAEVVFLVDTGAPYSMIDREIVEGLQIEPIGRHVGLRTAAGIVPECPMYRVELHMHLRNGVGVLPTTVLGLETGGLLTQRRFRGVLGRSSLQKARFLYDGVAGTFDIELVK